MESFLPKVDAREPSLDSVRSGALPLLAGLGWLRASRERPCRSRLSPRGLGTGLGTLAFLHQTAKPPMSPTRRYPGTDLVLPLRRTSTTAVSAAPRGASLTHRRFFLDTEALLSWGSQTATNPGGGELLSTTICTSTTTLSCGFSRPPRAFRHRK